MADSDLFFYSVIGFFAGIYFFFKGFKWQRQKQLIENTPTSKIRSVAMGPVEVFGGAVPSQTGVLKSPLTAKDCVYYRYTIEEFRKSGKHSNWVTIKSGEDSKLFFLKDDTGSVLVDPKGAEINIPPDFSFESGLGKDPPQNVKMFLKENGMSHEGLFGTNRALRFREYRLEPGDKVYIMGIAGDNPFVETGAAKQSMENVIIHKGGKESFYYISDKSEKNVLKGFGRKVAGGIFGGGALTIICLAVILIYLKLL